jgi:hypothetical protein
MSWMPTFASYWQYGGPCRPISSSRWYLNSESIPGNLLFSSTASRLIRFDPRPIGVRKDVFVMRKELMASIHLEA